MLRTIFESPTTECDTSLSADLMQDFEEVYQSLDYNHDGTSIEISNDGKYAAFFDYKKKIGILGGSFDPSHKGHLKISIEAKKKFKINKIIWAITKKNPFKSKSHFTLKKRIALAKKITKKYNFISVKFYEDKIKSNKTIDLINYLKKKNNKTEIFLLIGADNIISFHRWHKWKIISSKCNILVFDRTNYKSKSLKSVAFKKLNNKRLKFVKFKKVNISSSKLKKI